MVLITEGFEVTCTVQDNGKGKSTLSYPLDPANVADFAAAQTARTAIVAALNGVTQGSIVGTTLKETQYENAIVFPASNVEIENKASITVQIRGKNKKANIRIPAVDPALFNGMSGAAADQIDVNNAALGAYVALYYPTAPVFISDGEHVDNQEPNNNGIVVGKRISAKNNNG